MKIEYRFKARDMDIGLDLVMFVVLTYSPSNTIPDQGFPNPAGPSTTIVLGEFNAHDVSLQAYNWFVGQYNIEIDQAAFCNFLSMIQTYTCTPFIGVTMTIEKSDD